MLKSGIKLEHPKRSTRKDTSLSSPKLVKP